MVVIFDFGSQTTHLIARRIKELGGEPKILSPNEDLSEILQELPEGLVLSGGPAGVYQKNSPTLNPQIFSLKIPILGICYGLQLTTKLLGGKVIPGKREYGPAKLKIVNYPPAGGLKIANDLPKSFVVWMSHGDEITKLPRGFEIIGESENLPFAFVGDHKNLIYGLQFHPEVEHTENGSQILANFLKIPIRDLVE